MLQGHLDTQLEEFLGLKGIGRVPRRAGGSSTMNEGTNPEGETFTKAGEVGRAEILISIDGAAWNTPGRATQRTENSM